MKTESGGDRNKVAKEQQQEVEELRRGPWTLDEDNLLIHYVACHGEGRWNLLAKSAGLKRTGKSCRLRWLNYLKPDIKRGNLTPQEQLMILELHSKWGNRWSKIAAHLPGRTDNEIKNYWRTRVQKQAKQLNMESNSPSFVDAIRCFYMPRLVQKIEQSSTSSTTLNSEGSASSSPSQKTQMDKDLDLDMDMDMVLSPTKLAHINLDNPLDISEITDLPSSASSSAYPKTDDCYYVGNSYYDMDHLPSTSAPEILATDCHVAGHNWPADDTAEDGVWDLDELWQFRK